MGLVAECERGLQAGALPSKEPDSSQMPAMESGLLIRQCSGVGAPGPELCTAATCLISTWGLRRWGENWTKGRPIASDY